MSSNTNKIRENLKKHQRIVIKIGSSTLVYPDGTENLQRIERIAFALSDLKNQGKEVILVSSGSLTIGLAHLEQFEHPTTIPEQQAISAVGQTVLMNYYTRFFNQYGYHVGQLLLTRDVLDFPESRQNVINTFEQLLDQNILPIVNENDTVSVEELDHLTRFGDNDTLSALVLELTEADLLIMMSDIDGFYDKNPIKYDDAEKFDVIHEVNENLYQKASESTTRFGTGGMTTKLNSAEIVLRNKKEMVLVNGEDPIIIFDVINGKNVGTLFTTNKEEKES